MAFYVHLTDTVRSEATAHSVLESVERISRDIQTSQGLSLFEPFGPLFKRNLGRSFRLLVRHYAFGDDDLVVFLRVYARGSTAYETLYPAVDRIVPGNPDFEPYNGPELARLYAELSAVEPPVPAPTPSDEEYAWLYEALVPQGADEDVLILEADPWVKGMKSEANRDLIAYFRELVENLVERIWAAPDVAVPCEVADLPDRGVRVVFAYDPESRRLILFAPLRKGDDASTTLEAARRDLDNARGKDEGLTRLAARAYPSLMIADQIAWFAIQKDDAANVALSAEEAGLLRAVRSADDADGIGFPLFINGRAGSGKSTMLQYLAAEYLDFGLRRQASLRPVYLTSSRDLLARAKDTTTALLTAHHARLASLGGRNRSETAAAIEGSFFVYKDFLRGLLSADEAARLADDKYVGYARFRALWSKEFARRPEARRIKPDVAWHTIRSYIKGTREALGDDMDPAGFAELSRRRRSVTEATFEAVYVQVWEGWYKPLCEREGLWDDQDLATLVLESDAAKGAEYAAVFCDEAQDFTPIELEIIFQLSVFAGRSLKPEELRHVPIAFAGDPLQTINPTGFRWETVKADFRDRFLRVLDSRRRADIELSYQELHFNYRSDPGIVRFCNLIQLVRAAALGGATRSHRRLGGAAGKRRSCGLPRTRPARYVSFRRARTWSRSSTSTRGRRRTSCGPTLPWGRSRKRRRASTATSSFLAVQKASSFRRSSSTGLPITCLMSSTPSSIRTRSRRTPKTSSPWSISSTGCMWPQAGLSVSS